MPHSTSDSRSDLSTSSNFPQYVGVPPSAPCNGNGNGHLSPAMIFPYESSPRSSSSNNRPVTEFKGNIMQDIKSRFSGDQRDFIAEEPSSQTISSRRRTRYFEEQFSYKASQGPARERVGKDSPVLAELKTNVKINDECTFSTDFSNHLSTRFHRPESSILISTIHSACMMFAGSFEPSYVLTITALPTQVQPVTNKRNIALIQEFMAEVLRVPPERGIVRFSPITEENYGRNGRTVLAEIQLLDRQMNEENSGALKRALTSKSSRISPRLGTKPRKESITTPSTMSPSINTPHSAEFGNRKTSAEPNRPEKCDQIHALVPPPIPDDPPMLKVKKRKSFLAVFRR